MIVLRACRCLIDDRGFRSVPSDRAAARDSSDAPAFNTSAHAVPSGYFKISVLLRR